MFLTIIMPVHNAEEFLEASIASVINQTDANFELLIVNDGSTDNSIEIIEKHAARDSRIRFFSQRKSGVSNARNLGLAEARGDYVTFIDSDDTIEADTFSTCVERLTTHPSDLLIYSINYITRNGTRRLDIDPLQDHVYSSMEEFMTAYMASGAMSIYSNCNKFYRRPLIENHRIRFNHETHFGEDRIFNYDFLKEAKSVTTLSRKFYSYHLRNNESLSNRFISNFMKTILDLHRAKAACVVPYAESRDQASTFITNDLRHEVRNAVDHLRRHWKKLSRRQRLDECKLLINASYPDCFYSDQFVQGSNFLRRFRTMVKLKNPAILYGWLMLRSGLKT